jgi:hypothetical protein
VGKIHHLWNAYFDTFEVPGVQDLHEILVSWTVTSQNAP